MGKSTGGKPGNYTLEKLWVSNHCALTRSTAEHTLQMTSDLQMVGLFKPIWTSFFLKVPNLCMYECISKNTGAKQPAKNEFLSFWQLTCWVWFPTRGSGSESLLPSNWNSSAVSHLTQPQHACAQGHGHTHTPLHIWTTFTDTSLETGTISFLSHMMYACSVDSYRVNLCCYTQKRIKQKMKHNYES